MNKIWLIIQREFLNRVQKKSFLLTTIIVPLIIPAIMGGLIFFMIKEAESAKADVIELVDETAMFPLESSKKFTIVAMPVPIDQAKKAFQESDHFGLLYIPKTDVNNPKGITLYTKESQSLEKIGNIEGMINDKVKDFKMEK